MAAVGGGGVAPNVLGIDEVVRLAALAGWRGEYLATAVAIAKAESGFNANAAGDGHLADRKWGLSLGLWQIRSLNAERGTGKTRDADQLRDPAFNARSAYAISSGGTNWRPWSVYTSGAYRKHMAAARSAVSRFAGGAGRGAGVTPGLGADVARPGAHDGRGLGRPEFDFVDHLFGPQTTLPVRFGSLTGGEIGQFIIGTTLDLTIDKVSELHLEILDEGFRLQKRHQLNIGTLLDFAGLKWQVIELGLQDKPVPHVLVLECQPYAVERLRSTPAPPVSNLSPTDYLADAAKAVGLDFRGEPTLKRPTISAEEVRADLPGIDTELPETVWQIGARFAREEGLLFFEAAGVLCFGSADWLARHGRRVQFTYGSASYGPEFGPKVEILTGIRLRAAGRHYRSATAAMPLSADYLKNVRAQFDVSKEDGEGLRPAMGAAVAGVGPLSGGGLLVSRVSRNYMEQKTRVELITIESKVQKGTVPADAFGDAAPEPSADPARSQPRRISNDDRARLFGPPGDQQRYVSWTTPWGITVRVHNLVLPRFRSACEDANRSSTWRPRRIDSYNLRKIKGSSSYSLHSWALAWDIFSSSPGVPPPGGVQSKQSAPDDAFLMAFKSWGFYLGQEFRNNYDAPHVEWAGVPPGDWAAPPRRPPGSASGPQP